MLHVKIKKQNPVTLAVLYSTTPTTKLVTTNHFPARIKIHTFLCPFIPHNPFQKTLWKHFSNTVLIFTILYGDNSTS